MINVNEAHRTTGSIMHTGNGASFSCTLLVESSSGFVPAQEYMNPSTTGSFTGDNFLSVGENRNFDWKQYNTLFGNITSSNMALLNEIRYCVSKIEEKSVTAVFKFYRDDGQDLVVLSIAREFLSNKIKVDWYVDYGC
jgi:hypothetical protein